MKPALQALLYAPDIPLWTYVILGQRTVTIREGHRDYRPGPVMLCCHIASACVMADVAEARHCLLWEVAEEECRASGSPNREALLEDLRRFYPSMGPESPVTVIRLENFRGRLIDNRMLVMAPERRGDDPTIARLNGPA